MTGRKHIRPFCEISEWDAMVAARALDAIYPKLPENEQKMIDRAVKNAMSEFKLGLQSAKSLVASMLVFMGENGMLEEKKEINHKGMKDTKEEPVQEAVIYFDEPPRNCPDCGHEMVSVSGKRSYPGKGARLRWKCVNLQCRNRRVYDELFFVTAQEKTDARAESVPV